jgi:hypothetical protein
VRAAGGGGAEASCVTCPTATTVRAFTEEFTVDLVHGAASAGGGDGTAMQKWRIVRSGFGTARQKMVLE